MGAFWNSWQLWEKLCFCLAVAIFLTLYAGCVKLVHQRWQLRKYTSIAAKKMEQRQEQQQEMQRALSARRDRKNDVPFGVRAIESGIEVDGVWISRGNTPVPGSPVSIAARPSPPNSQRRDRQSSTLGSTSSIPDLTMPQPAYPITKPTSGRNTSTSSRSASPNSRFEKSRGSSPERHSPMRGVSPQPGSEFASHARQSYRPRQSSHLRYSSADVLGSSEEDIVMNQNMPPLPHNLRNMRSGSGTSLRPESPLGHYMPTKPSPTKAAARKSLRIPRTVSPTSASPTHSTNGQFSFERIPLDNIATSSSTQNDPFLTPRESPTDNSKDYFSGLPSFQSFVEIDPRNSQHQDFMSNSSPQDYENSYLDHTDARIPNARNADVIRKVNSGFEILRPGTLGSKPKDAPETYQPTGGDGHRRQSKKLQKRVRSSTLASRRSMFSEDVVKFGFNQG